MSGGVDSSVCAALLKDAGHELHGITLQLWRGDPKKGIEWYERACCKADVARQAAQKIDIPFTVINIQEEFEKEIVDDFCKEYLSGRTPNPCIRCNEKIKFGLLLKKARELGAERLATGHYARIEFNPAANRFILKKAADSKKNGEFVETEGNVIGKHNGIAFYTIGQRKGLGISSTKRLYVIDIDAVNNRVILGDEEGLFKDELIAEDINLIAIERLDKPMDVNAKIRYRNTAVPAEIIPFDEGKVKVKFKEPQRAIARGQSVVFYDNDIVIGGGIIL